MDATYAALRRALTLTGEKGARVGGEGRCRDRTASNVIQCKGSKGGTALLRAVRSADHQVLDRRILYAQDDLRESAKALSGGCGTRHHVSQQYYMVLFDVPGWSIPEEPVAAAPKKRKRTSKQDSNKVQSATVNVERLIEQLATGPAAENTRGELKEGISGGVSADGDRLPRRRRVKRNKSRQSPTPTAAVQEDGTHTASGKKRKKTKRQEKRSQGRHLRWNLVHPRNPAH